MKLTLIKAFVLFFAAASSVAFALVPELQPININRNKVGLPDNAHCSVYHTKQGPVITCQTIFKNAAMKPTCATCTPGWLSFENYIGTLMGPSMEGPGKTRAVIFCDGECVPVSSKTESPILPEII